MTHIAHSLRHPGLRIALAVGSGLAGLLAIVGIVRPEMMSMVMIRHLFVGFGL